MEFDWATEDPAKEGKKGREKGEKREGGRETEMKVVMNGRKVSTCFCFCFFDDLLV